MVEFEDAVSERMAQLEQEDLERYQRDILRNSSYSYVDETPNYVDEFQSKLPVLLDVVRGILNNLEQKISSFENGSDDVTSYNNSGLRSETADEHLSDEGCVVNESPEAAEMPDFGDFKSTDSPNSDEMPKFTETVVSESGLQVLSIYCAHMAPKWRPALDSQPIQGDDMSVEVYYNHFFNWKRELEEVNYIGGEESYVDDFIYGLEIKLGMRVCGYKWKPHTLYGAYRRALIEDFMMKNDAGMVLEETPHSNFIGIQGAKYVLNENANVVPDGLGLLDIKLQLDLPVESNSSLYINNGRHAKFPWIAHIVAHGENYIEVDLNTLIDSDLLIKKFSFDPGGCPLPNLKMYEQSTLVEKNERDVVDGGVVVFVLDLQATLGPLGDLTVNCSENGLTKAWHDEATLAIKNVPRKSATVDDAYKEFGETTQAIRGTLLEKEVMNHSAKYADFNKLILFDPGGNRKCEMSFSKDVACLLFGNAQEMFVFAFKGIIPALRHAYLLTDTWKMHCLTSSCLKVALNLFNLSTQLSTKQNIGSKGLEKWDQSMAEIKEVTMEMMCGEIVLFMLDPCISSLFDEIFHSLQEAQLDEQVTDLYTNGFYFNNPTLFDPRGDRNYALRCVNDALTKAIEGTFFIKVWILRNFVIFYREGFLEEIFLSSLSLIFPGGHDEFGQQLVEGVVTLGSVLRAILLRRRIVTTILKIIKGNGLILWACEELGSDVTEPLIDFLIQSHLLEKRYDALYCRYDALGAAYTLQWAFLKEPGLMFSKVYQWFLHPLYVDDLFFMVLQVVISFYILEDKDVLEWLGKDIILIDVMLLIMSSWYSNSSHTHSLTNSPGISYIEVSLAWLAMLVDLMCLMPEKVITGISGHVSFICVSRSSKLLPLTLIMESLLAMTVIDSVIHWCLCDELGVHYSRLTSSPFNLWSGATAVLQLFNTVYCCSFGYIGGSNASYTVLGFEQNIYHTNASSRKCCSILRILYYLLKNNCFFDHDEYIGLGRSVLVMGLHAKFVEFNDELHVIFSICLEDDQDDICCIIFLWCNFNKALIESICSNVLMEWSSVEPHTTFCSKLLKHGMDGNVFAIFYHSFEIHLAAQSEREIQYYPSYVLENFIWDPGLWGILDHNGYIHTTLFKFARIPLMMAFKKMLNIINSRHACHWDSRKPTLQLLLT